MALNTTKDTQNIISIDTTKPVSELKLLRDEIKAAKEALLTSKEGTKEYSDALQIAADKAFALREMQVKIRGTANDLGEILANGTKVLGGIASGFSAAQGAMALFGIENDSLQKGLLKVQAAMAIANGIQGVEGLGKNLSNLATQLSRTSVGTKVITAAQWLWNAALAANPITLVVAAVVALGAAIYGLTKYFESSQEAIDKENTSLDGLVFASKEAKEAHEEHIYTMEKLAIRYDITTGKITEFQGAMRLMQIENAKALDDLNKDTDEKLEANAGFWMKTWRTIKNFGSFKNAMLEEALEAGRIAEEQEQKRKDKLAEYAADVLNQAKIDTEKRWKELEREAKEAKRISDEKAKEEDKSAANLLQNKKDLNAFILQEEKNLNASVLAEELAAKKEKEDLDAAVFQYEIDLGELKRKKAEEDTEAQAKKDKEDLEAAQAKFEAKKTIQMAELDLLAGAANQIGQIFEKNKKVQKAALLVEKAVAIAQIWLNNAVANAKAKVLSPPLGLPWTIINTISAGVQTASVIAQTAKALQALGGGDSGGGSAPAQESNRGSASAPNIPQSIQPTRNQLTSNELNLQTQPIKAYVVETELTAIQKRVNTIKNEATF